MIIYLFFDRLNLHYQQLSNFLMKISTNKWISTIILLYPALQHIQHSTISCFWKEGILNANKPICKQYKCSFPHDLRFIPNKVHNVRWRADFGLFLLAVDHKSRQFSHYFLWTRSLIDNMDKLDDVSTI